MDRLKRLQNYNCFHVVVYFGWVIMFASSHFMLYGSGNA